MELSAPQHDIATSRKQINGFLAGQGSGKSHVAGAISADFITNFPAARGLIAANTYSQLTRSTLFRVREVWKEFGIVEYNEKTGKGHYVTGKQPPSHFTKLYDYDNYNNIISFSWGTVVYVGSLDNYKALDGMEITWAMLDETKDTKETAVKEVIVGRLRQRAIYIDETGELMGQPKDKYGNDLPIPEHWQEFNPLYIFTSPAKVPWLNEWFNLEEYAEEIKKTIYFPPDYFRKEFDNKLITISSTHLNEKNLPKKYIPNQMSNLSKALQNMLIYGDPFSKAGGEFYKGFDQRVQVVKGLRSKYYTEDLPLHLSFDFNVSPYITLTVWQAVGKVARQFAEYCLQSPNNTTVRLCQTFLKDFGKHTGGVFIYGDPAGKHKDTRTEQGGNDYTIIFRELANLKPKDRVAHKAPAVAMRGQFINGIFESKLYGIELYFDDTCRNTIGDYLYLKEASDGTKLKAKETDDSGVTFEKYGHTSDANDYMLCKMFESDWNKFLVGGKGTSVHAGARAQSNKAY